MIASEMPAAIRPYSIAVAPDSSDKKFKTVRFNSTSMGCYALSTPAGFTGPDLRASKRGTLNLCELTKNLFVVAAKAGDLVIAGLDPAIYGTIHLKPGWKGPGIVK
jgi:hypothetical protein